MDVIYEEIQELVKQIKWHQKKQISKARVWDILLDG